MFDAEGLPVVGAPVRLIGQFGVSKLPFSSKQPEERELLKGVTDSQGFFSFSLPDDRGADRLLVRATDSSDWDAVRYAPEDDVDITRDFRRRNHAVVTIALADASGWRELQRELDQVGVATSRGKILRRHGFPNETVQLAGGGLEWRYPSVTYVFDVAGQLIESRPRKVTS